MTARLPEQLAPTAVEHLHLPSGRNITLPKAKPSFRPWTGKPIGDDYGGKPVLEWQGGPYFAELLILELLRAEGWDGFWVDTYRNRRILDMSLTSTRQLPAGIAAVIAEIRARCGTHSGCFDVVAEREGEILFAEAKRASKDRLRETQLRWIDAALHCGVHPESLLIVEWAIVRAQSLRTDYRCRARTMSVLLDE